MQITGGSSQCRDWKGLSGHWRRHWAEMEPLGMRNSGNESEKSLRLDHEDPHKDSGFRCE